MRTTKCQVCMNEFIHYPWTDPKHPLHWECRPCDYCGRPVWGKRSPRILRPPVTNRRIRDNDCAPWDCYCLLDISIEDRIHFTTQAFLHWLLSAEKRIELIQIVFLNNCFLDKQLAIDYIRRTEEFDKFLPGDDLVFMAKLIRTFRSHLVHTKSTPK